METTRSALVLLDLTMPDMDGIETLQLRSNPAHRDIPVVMITAISDPRSRLRAMELGANDYWGGRA